MAEEKEEKKLTEETVKEEKPKKAPRTQKVKENIVFVGSKPPMSYVLAIITSLSASNAKERARALPHNPLFFLMHALFCCFGQSVSYWK